MRWDPAETLLTVFRKLAFAPSYPRVLRVGRAVGRALGFLTRYRRRDAMDALRHSFPDASEVWRRRVLGDMYAYFGMNLADSLRMLDEPVDVLRSRVRMPRREILVEELARGKGALVLTAHIGNWEMFSMACPLLGLPLTLIAKPIRGRALARHMQAVRTRFGQRVLPARGSYRECLRALRRNDVLGFILDQNMTRRDGVFVNFFGRLACTTLGLAHLSARTGVRVIPAFTYRNENGLHEIDIQDPIEPPSDAKAATLTAATQEYTLRIEQFIRQHPEQWIWIHRRWKTRPPKPESSRDSCPDLPDDPEPPGSVPKTGAPCV